nr:MAG TPA: hypothetical protein [Caudoviricetes sp.]
MSLYLVVFYYFYTFNKFICAELNRVGYWLVYFFYLFI